jgi:putative transposase
MPMQQKLNKTKRAQDLGVSRSSLYYKHKRDALDLDMKERIEGVMKTHHSYEHKRIAIELKLNKKRILRVMKKYDMKPYKRRVKKPVKKDDMNKAPVEYPNLIKNICPIRPNVIWVTDFTYLKFNGTFIYLATIMDLYTREIVGWNISAHHNKELVIGALTHAMARTKQVPLYIHSDQGSEYDSEAFIQLVQFHKILVSMSKKKSPWENGFQESFYAQFKVDLGFLSRFDSVEELIEGIYQAIHYYNYDRIHTSLKMSPILFKQKYADRLRITV